MIKVLYDPSGKKLTNTAEMATKIIMFVREKSDIEIPVEQFLTFFIAGKYYACGIENDHGELEQLCIYMIRERYFIGRGKQVCVQWFYGQDALDMAASEGMLKGANEIEWPVENTDEMLMFKRRELCLVQ
jgi:hypothetical protein